MKRSVLILTGLLLSLSMPCLAQESASPATIDKIAWHGTWQGGLAEAKRTGNPILLVSAVPQCHSVPGVW